MATAVTSIWPDTAYTPTSGITGLGPRPLAILTIATTVDVYLLPGSPIDTEYLRRLADAATELADRLDKEMPEVRE